MAKAARADTGGLISKSDDDVGEDRMADTPDDFDNSLEKNTEKNSNNCFASSDEGGTVGPHKPVPLYPLNLSVPGKAEGVMSLPGAGTEQQGESSQVPYPLSAYGGPIAGYPGMAGTSTSGMCLPNSVDSMDSFINSTVFYAGKGQNSPGERGDFVPHFVFTPRHPMGKKYFRCPQCRYYTDRKNNLKRHIGTMHQDCGKVLECCDIMFRSKAALRDHIMLFHRTGYRCKHCGRNFCRKALLKRHLAVHGGQKEYYCDNCDYATSQRASFNRHTRNHSLKSFGSEEDDALESKLGILQASQQDQLNFWYLASGCLPESIFPYQRAGTLFNKQNSFPGPDRLGLGQVEDREQTPSVNSGVGRAAEDIDVSEVDTEESDKNINSDEKEARSRHSFAAFPDMESLDEPFSLFNKRLFDRPYKCNDCSSTFSNQQHFRDHVKQCKKQDAAEPQPPLKLLVKPHSEKGGDRLGDMSPPSRSGDNDSNSERRKGETATEGHSPKPKWLPSGMAQDGPIDFSVGSEKKSLLFNSPFPPCPPLYKSYNVPPPGLFRPDPFYSLPLFGWLGGGAPFPAPDVLPWALGARKTELAEASQGAAPHSPPLPPASPGNGDPDTDGSQGLPGEPGSSLPFKKRLLHS